MRILVCSDSHGRQDRLVLALEQQRSAEILVFLGDGAADAAFFAREPGKQAFLVRGNWDGPACELPLWQEFFVLDKKILCTHGHTSQVKFGPEALLRAARDRGADLVLFGHTHRPLISYEDGVHLFNPGSLWEDGSYGFVDVTGAGIVCRSLRVRER
ncbi:MAG: YfcE family phosphodiesterase [Oscillospiraceae bacterium]|nr:YfcE family phosphodiesterase [Oscillospiraceae bacterium]